MRDMRAGMPVRLPAPDQAPGAGPADPRQHADVGHERGGRRIRGHIGVERIVVDASSAWPTSRPCGPAPRPRWRRLCTARSACPTGQPCRLLIRQDKCVLADKTLSDEGGGSEPKHLLALLARPQQLRARTSGSAPVHASSVMICLTAWRGNPLAAGSASPARRGAGARRIGASARRRAGCRTAW